MRADDKKYLKEKLIESDTVTLDYTSGARRSYWNIYGVELKNLPGDGPGLVHYMKKGFLLEPPENPEPMPDVENTAVATIERDQTERQNQVVELKLARQQALAEEAATGFEDDDADAEIGKGYSALSQSDEAGSSEMCKVCTHLAKGDTGRKALAELGRHATIEHTDN